MKKKSLVAMMGALALVGALGAGATLAYMSATDEVRNTFTFTEAGIAIVLDEAVVDENNKATAERTSEGQDYENIIPGMVIDKDPTVTVKASSLNCNVFVSVENANAATVLAIDDLNTTAWAVVNPATYGLTAADNTTYYVYQGTKATGTPETGDSFSVVAKSAADVVLEDVFQTVSVGTSVSEETDFEDIVIKAAAVQADSCADADAAKTALGMLGATAQ